MLTNLIIGDIIVLGKQYALSKLFGRKVLKVLYENMIVFYQRERFGDCAYCDATHVLKYCGAGKCFEVTDPESKWTSVEELEAHIRETGRKVWVFRYNRYQWRKEDANLVDEIVNPMVGKKYAYLDILPFILEKVIGFLPNAYKLVTNIFGDSWKKYMFKLIAGSNNIFLCSTGVAAIYGAMHKRKIGTSGESLFPRPFATSDGGNEYVEMVTPAHFGCWPGDFKEIPQ